MGLEWAAAMLEEDGGREGGGRRERRFLPAVSAGSDVCGLQHGQGEGKAKSAAKLGGGGTDDYEVEGRGQQGEAGVEKEEGPGEESGADPKGQGLTEGMSTEGMSLEVFRPGGVIPSPCALDYLRLFD